MVIVGHESPHKFDAPSLDYLRTGQGANSYTGGLYNYESPAVGQNYHDEFTRKLERQNPAIDEWRRRAWKHDNWTDWQSRMRKPYSESFGSLDHLSLSPEQRRELGELRQKILNDNYASGNFGQTLDNLTAEAYRNSDAWKASIPYYERMYEMLPQSSRSLQNQLSFFQLQDNNLPYFNKDEWASSFAFLHPHYDDHRSFYGKPEPPMAGVKPESDPAFTYHFNLHSPRENFVEYMRPIREQRGWLRDALMDVAREANDTVYGDGEPWLGGRNTPADLYDALKDYRPPNAGQLIDGRRIPSRYRDSSAHPNLGEFESALVDRGIPGIRYPDAFSRSRPDNSPSRTENFVVYDPSIMELVKRYPYSLLAPALLADGAKEQQTPVQSPLAGSLLQ
jgi:hypothetical protein